MIFSTSQYPAFLSTTFYRHSPRESRGQPFRNPSSASRQTRHGATFEIAGVGRPIGSP